MLFFLLLHNAFWNMFSMLYFCNKHLLYSFTYLWILNFYYFINVKLKMHTCLILSLCSDNFFPNAHSPWRVTIWRTVLHLKTVRRIQLGSSTPQHLRDYILIPSQVCIEKLSLLTESRSCNYVIILFLHS